MNTSDANQLKFLIDFDNINKVSNGRNGDQLVFEVIRPELFEPNADKMTDYEKSQI